MTNTRTTNKYKKIKMKTEPTSTKRLASDPKNWLIALVDGKT